MSASKLPILARCTDHIFGAGIVEVLESGLSELAGCPFVLATSSASMALEATYRACGLGAGAEVVLPSLTAPETAAPLLRGGCLLVLADIDPVSLTIDPASVERCITAATGGVVGVDLLGYPHDTAGIRSVIRDTRIAYVSDSAQAFGARRGGRSSGYAADAVVFSLNAQKDLAAGEGGAVATRCRRLYEAVLKDTQHASRQARELGPQEVNPFSHNGRINPLSAAVAVDSLPAVLERIETRRRRAAGALELLASTDYVDAPAIPRGVEPTFPCLTAAWRGRPRRVELLRLLHDEGMAGKFREIPLRPLHCLASLWRRYPDQVRVPYPLVHTDEQVARRWCLELL